MTLLHQSSNIAGRYPVRPTSAIKFLDQLLTADTIETSMSVLGSSGSTPLLPSDAQAFSDDVNAHASPLMPLQERDLLALIDLFERSDSHEIQANIQQQLECLYPEPCWDEELFDFLKDYL